MSVLYSLDCLQRSKPFAQRPQFIGEFGVTGVWGRFDDLAFAEIDTVLEFIEGGVQGCNQEGRRSLVQGNPLAFDDRVEELGFFWREVAREICFDGCDGSSVWVLL